MFVVLFLLHRRCRLSTFKNTEQKWICKCEIKSKLGNQVATQDSDFSDLNEQLTINSEKNMPDSENTDSACKVLVKELSHEELMRTSDGYTLAKTTARNQTSEMENKEDDYYTVI